jgi:AcrR family transcriptional regulator
MEERQINRKTRYTRMVLRDSLIELMAQKPITKITIKEICENADVNRTTFYAHYQDQYDLLLQIEEETLVYFDDMLNKYNNKLNKREVIEMLEKMLHYIASNHNSIQVLLSENGDIGFQKKVFKRFAQHELVLKYLAEEKFEEKTTGYYYVYVINGSVGLIQHWLKNNMDMPVPELARILVRPYLKKGS